MLIKSADDKSKRLALLQDLQKSSLLDARQKEWLRVELRNLSAGIRGEREAAFHLDGTAAPTQASASLAKKLICAYSREKISFHEGNFCWNNA